MLPATVQAYQHRQRNITETVARAVAVWEQVDSSRVHDSWRQRLEQITALITSAQLAAAAQAITDASAMVTDAGATPHPEATVQPSTLAGVASDGRPLPGLLLAPAMHARARLAAGAPIREARRTGAVVLTRITATQVADAARVATGIRLLIDRAVSGYVRRIQPPACPRCLVQDGKWFATNTGFSRHPNCDCVHEPVLAGETPPRRDLRGLLDQMTDSELARTFGSAVARRLRDGSDPARLVDVGAGMAVAGTSSQDGRVMPEALFATSTSRAHAIELLHRHGYVT